MDNQLEKLRQQIDTIDDDIIKLLSKRMTIAKEIGKIKKEQYKNIYDENRWNNLLLRIIEKAQIIKLDTTLVKNIFELIHNESQKVQKQV